MVHDLPEKLVTENDDVSAVVWKCGMLHVAAVPDACFTHKAKTGLVNDPFKFALSFGSKEDGCSEDAPEGVNQPSVLSPPCRIPKVSSISPALSNEIVWLC